MAKKIASAAAPPPASEYVFWVEWPFLESPEVDASTVRVQAIAEAFANMRHQARSPVLRPTTVAAIIGRPVDVGDHRRKLGFAEDAEGDDQPAPKRIDGICAVKAARAVSGYSAEVKARLAKLDVRLLFARGITDEAIRAWLVIEYRANRMHRQGTTMTDLGKVLDLKTPAVRTAVDELIGLGLAEEARTAEGVFLRTLPIDSVRPGRLRFVEFTSDELDKVQLTLTGDNARSAALLKRSHEIKDRRRRSREGA